MSDPFERDRDPGADALAGLRRFNAEFQSRARQGDPGPRDPHEAQDRERRYRDVLEVSRQLNSTLDLDTVLENILDGVLRVTGCQRALLMFRESDGTFSMHIGRTRDGSGWQQEALRISRTIVERVAESGEPFIAADLSGVEGLGESVVVEKIRSAVCLPLKFKDELVGVIYADSRGVAGPVFDEDHSILDAFSSQAAVAIENARRHGEIVSQRRQLEEQNISLRHQLGQEFSLSGMISRHKSMHRVFEMVERIAANDITVLIEGESGTGKGLLARAIHDLSDRRAGRLVSVNCSAFSPGLVESILFGHKRGAFTGATADKKGVFELADGGTLFLDEIAEMPIEIQPVILHAVQEGEFTRVGEEDVVRRVNVRVICATNKNLAALVEQGAFRQDLFYRLNTAYIKLPPLRERPDDILPLAEHFLTSYQQEKGGQLAVLSPDARRFLLAQAWEGNVRELQGAIHRGILLQDEEHVIHARDLAQYLADGHGAPATVPETGTLKERILRFEEDNIRRALTENGNNVTATARSLGISRQQLYNKLNKLGITVRDE